MQWAIISDFVLKLLKSKWFWLAIFIIVLFLVIRHNWDKIKITLGFTKPNINADPAQIAEIQQLSTDRKNQLNALSEALYVSFTDNNWLNSALSDSRIDALNNILACSDIETIYIANYYKGVNNTSIYNDLSSETTLLIWGQFENLSSLLLSKLRRLQQL